MIMDLVHAKSLFKFVLWHSFFICYPISKIFAAHSMTNKWLKLGKKIFYLLFLKLNIIQKNAFSQTSFSTSVWFAHLKWLINISCKPEKMLYCFSFTNLPICYFRILLNMRGSEENIPFILKKKVKCDSKQRLPYTPALPPSPTSIPSNCIEHIHKISWR